MSEALIKLSDLLAEPDARRSFLDDPEGTMERYGVDPSGVPPALVDTLRSLSLEELEVVSRVNIALRTGLTEDERRLMVQFPI
jgi:hypothetical protein